MRAVLAITLGKSGVDGFPDLSAWRVDRVEAGDAVARLTQDDYDAVVICVGVDVHETLHVARTLSPTTSERGVPLVLAVDAPGRGTAKLLAATVAEGLIDLRWPHDVMQACLAAVIRAVHSERRALRAQDVFLSAALGEAEHFKSLAYRDDLTLLSNRRYFERIIIREHARCARFRHPYSLVFVDLDNLKEVNSKHGHVVGGRVLEQVGAYIRSLTRSCDFAFRFGGDEFVTLLVDTEKQGAVRYAQRLCRGIKALDLEIDDLIINTSASAGVATFPDDGQTAREILTHADLAAYAAKAQGKARVVAYSHVLAAPVTQVPHGS